MYNGRHEAMNLSPDQRGRPLTLGLRATDSRCRFSHPPASSSLVWSGLSGRADLRDHRCASLQPDALASCLSRLQNRYTRRSARGRRQRQTGPRLGRRPPRQVVSIRAALALWSWRCDARWASLEHGRPVPHRRLLGQRDLSESCILLQSLSPLRRPLSSSNQGVHIAERSRRGKSLSENSGRPKGNRRSQEASVAQWPPTPRQKSARRHQPISHALFPSTRCGGDDTAR